MTITSKKIILSVFATYILFMGVLLTHYASASNKLSDMTINETDEKIDLSFHMDNVPKYGIRQPNWNQMIITLYDTSKDPAIDDKLTQYGLMALTRKEGAPDLQLYINLQNHLREVYSTWFSQEQRLHIEIFKEVKSKDTEPSALGTSILKNIRFGFKDDATRMVMTLDQQPAWMMTFHDPTTVALRLKASSTELKGKRYGPIKRLKEVIVLKHENKDMNIGLQSQSRLSSVRIFWMSLGNRLVMDLFDKDVEIPDNTISTTSTLIDRKAEARNSLTSKDPRIDQPPIQPAEGNPSETRHIVRKKIFKSNMIESAKTANKGPSPSLGGKNVPVTPKLNNALPGVSIDDKMVQDLQPEEAFLFGRIQGAREIKDYEKALDLIEQLLTQFPESPLSEKIIFWRGDLYHYLWERGDSELATQVIQNYKYAVNHFGKSKYAPAAYIKMAQVSSQIGDHYSAIGYLSVVVSAKKNEEYFPIAYLTRGKVFLQMDQPAKAVQDFETLIEKYPRSKHIGEANFWIANYFHAIGLYDEAEKRITAIEASDPLLFLDYPEHILLNAKNYLYLKKYDQARHYLFKALNLGRQTETPDLILSRIGDTYYHQDQNKEAETYYRMVMEYYPKTEGASIAQIRMADYFSDITMLDDLGAENADTPVSELALLEKAYQLYEKKLYSEVLENLEDTIIKPVPTATRKDAKALYIRALENMVQQLYLNEKYAEVINRFKANRDYLPESVNPELMLIMALSFKTIGQNKQAITTFNNIKLSDLDQNGKGQYIIGLAQSYLAEENNKKAQQTLVKHQNEKLNPADAQKVTMLLADIYLEQGQHGKAYPLYQSLAQRSQRLAPKDRAKVYLSIGKISKAEKNYRKAEEILKQSIALLEKDKNQQNLLQWAYIELGNVFYDQGKIKLAAKSYEQGFDLGYGPDNMDYWELRFCLALSYMNAGNLVKAESLLNEISGEGDLVLQQKAQIRLGTIGLEKHLNRLSINMTQ